MLRLQNSRLNALVQHYRSYLMLFLLTSFYLTSHTYAQPSAAVPQGVVPIIKPVAGFGIDGDLRAQVPNNAIFENSGDWFPITGNQATGVFRLTGTSPSPVETDNTFYKFDYYTSGDNTLEGGLKKNGNLNDYTWKTGKTSPGKCDINNLFVHIGKAYANPEPFGREGDIWITVAGDRESTNGNSFISIALHRSRLSAPNGTFVTGVGDETGGRTPGDVQISAEYTGGGRDPNLYLEVWKEVPENSGKYVWDAKPLLLNEAFGSTNAALLSLTGLPFTAFGKTSYEINSFIEVSFNISAIYRGIGGCTGPIRSLFVITKSSQSVTADLADFVDPIDVNIIISTDDPVVTSPINYCSGYTGTVTPFLDRVTALPGATLNWYTAATGGSPIAAADLPIRPSLTASSTYWVSQTLNGCESGRIPVTTNITQRTSQPEVDIVPISCTSLTFDIVIRGGPVDGTTYTQTGNCVNTFTGLTFGGGYIVTATSGSCPSVPVVCGPAVGFDCPTGLAGTTTQVEGKTATQAIKLESSETTKVLAAPNPFNDRVRFSLQSGVSGQGSLDLFNSSGQRVDRVFQGYVEKGKIKTLEYNAVGTKKVNLYYVFTVGDQKTTGTLINLK